MTDKKTESEKPETVAKEVPKAPQTNVTGAEADKDGFTMQTVSSSQIAAMGHKESVMRVEFTNGSTYDYHAVDAERFKSILRAESVGKAFNTLVKANPEAFPFVKV